MAESTSQNRQPSEAPAQPPRQTWRLLALALAVLTPLVVLGGWWWQRSRPETRLRRGQEALRRGDLRTTHGLIASLAAAGYADHAHLLRGEALFDDGRYDKALDEFNQIQDQGVIRREAASLSGRCLIALQQYREAERVFSFVISEEPEHLEANRGLAAIYYDQGASLRALHHLEKVAALDPRHGRTFWLMGVILEDQPQDLPRAVSCYQQALQCGLPPDVADNVRQDLARLLVRLSRYEEAIATLDELSVPAQDAPRAIALRAESLWALGRGGQAVDLLERNQVEHPRDPSFQRVRVQIHLAAGEARQAAALLEAILTSEPHDEVSRSRLAQAYETLGRSADAAEQRRLHQQTQALIQELSKLNRQALDAPWDPDVRLKLAELCRKLGKDDLADMWRRAAAVCTASK